MPRFTLRIRVQGHCLIAHGQRMFRGDRGRGVRQRLRATKDASSGAGSAPVTPV